MMLINGGEHLGPFFCGDLRGTEAEKHATVSRTKTSRAENEEKKRYRNILRRVDIIIEAIIMVNEFLQLRRETSTRNRVRGGIGRRGVLSRIPTHGI